ncbi:MAG: recombinase family protein [Myxococcales bacterium]|nr:recombinase family protein [Myxococcales bacterium]
MSTEDQLLGPDAQRAALERWASARSVELVGVFEDRGVYGATALDRRPGLLAALDCMAEQRAGLLVAAKRDRFARDVILAAQLERLVERAGTKLMSTDGASDGDSPEVTMMRRILDVFGRRAATRGPQQPGPGAPRRGPAGQQRLGGEHPTVGARAAQPDRHDVGAAGRDQRSDGERAGRAGGSVAEHIADHHVAVERRERSE